ncbi:MAG TPA: GntR family transcriptional regulator [Terriglobales bacterium]|nr:GntR family transcriptional regulator [Terriglobales bacterium]
MDHTQINRVSVADQVAALLRQRILEGEFRPGTQLQELPLASSLGVSRNTMREAIRILALEGLLRRNLHRGVAISQLSLRDVAEIYQLRRMFELPAIFAARRPSADVLQEIRTALERYEEAVRAQNWPHAVSHDLHFHSLLIRFHGNKRLESFYQNMIGELRVGMVLVDRSHDDPGALIPVHRKMYQLLCTGKLKQCAAILEQHLEDSESRLTQVMNARAAAQVARIAH